VEDLDVEPGEVEALAAGDGLVGLVALIRPEPRPGHEAHDVGQHRDLDLGAVHRGPGRRGHRRHRPDVVEVTVGDEDRVDPHPELLDRAEDAVGLLAGVDDQPPLGAVAPQHVAVLGHRTDGEGADVHQPRACFWR
jgi:hypothetical protein